MPLPQSSKQPVKRAMRLPEVSDCTGLPSTTLYRLVKQGRFPKPYKLSDRVSAWNEAEVEAWLEEKLGGHR